MEVSSNSYASLGSFHCASSILQALELGSTALKNYPCAGIEGFVKLKYTTSVTNEKPDKLLYSLNLYAIIFLYIYKSFKPNGWSPLSQQQKFSFTFLSSYIVTSSN